MNVIHEFRQFEGRRLVGRGVDAPLAAYTALPRYHWLPSLIIELERADLRVRHPKGEEWSIVLQLDYRDEEPPRASLIVRPTVYGVRSPVFPIAPGYPLSLRNIRSAIRRHVNRLSP
jgi:hypothetical protein